FANTLALRTRLTGDLSFRDLLQQVRETALDAYAHQDLPFEKLVEQLQPKRDLSRTPIFQVMFVLQNAPMSSFDLPALRLNLFQADAHTSKFDLILFVNDGTDGRLNLSIEYSTSLFDESTIKRMLGHYLTLTQAIVASPERQILDLTMLDEEERRQVLVEWNDTASPLPAGLCLHHLFQLQARRSPDQIAVCDARRALSYDALDRRANRLAHFLRAAGVGPEAIVGVCLPRDAELVVALLGVLKAGGPYLPPDPAYPAPRLAFLVEQRGAALLLSTAGLAGGLGP